MTESVKEILAANSLLAKLPKTLNLPPNSQITSNKSNLEIEQADSVMFSIRDLVPVNSEYRPKYYAALYRMGAEAFWQLAERARKGKFPPHLFRRLIDGPKK
jgi:hypothetical protein